MAYKIIVSPRAQKEIIKAIDFYSEKSQNAPVNFILQLEKIYSQLAINPYYPVRYKNIRCVKIKKFPYSLYYVFDEKIQTVKILSCFQNKRNPKKRPKK